MEKHDYELMQLRWQRQEVEASALRYIISVTGYPEGLPVRLSAWDPFGVGSSFRRGISPQIVGAPIHMDVHEQHTYAHSGYK